MRGVQQVIASLVVNLQVRHVHAELLIVPLQARGWLCSLRSHFKKTCAHPFELIVHVREGSRNDATVLVTFGTASDREGLSGAGLAVRKYGGVISIQSAAHDSAGSNARRQLQPQDRALVASFLGDPGKHFVLSRLHVENTVEFELVAAANNERTGQRHSAWQTAHLVFVLLTIPGAKSTGISYSIWLCSWLTLRKVHGWKTEWSGNSMWRLKSGTKPHIIKIYKQYPFGRLDAAEDFDSRQRRHWGKPTSRFKNVPTHSLTCPKPPYIFQLWYRYSILRHIAPLVFQIHSGPALEGRNHSCQKGGSQLS